MPTLKTFFKKSIVAVVFGLLLPAQILQAQLLKVDGKNIIDEDGNTVVFRGLGLGGWLMEEGYMLQTPGEGSPTSIRNMIVDLIGEEDAAEFYRRYRQNYVAEEDVDLIARWGFNSIRLPFHYEILSPKDQPGVYLEEGFAYLDNMLEWCKKNELWLILDMHAAPGAQNHLNISDSDGEARLWTETENQDRTVEIWRKIAERYADEPWIAGYDLLNEPVLPEGHSNLELRDLYIRIANAIREVDSDHILFIEGNFFATDFNLLTPPTLYGENIVYAFHKYWNDPGKATIQYLLNIRGQWNVPLWLGESGENSNPWFHEVVKLMENEEIGWNWWTHKKVATITSPLSSPIEAGYQSVLDYWNGRISRPSQSFARDALFEMADNLALDKCERRPDVLAALLDPEFGVKTKPFIENVIPGTIDCADFDYGTNGVAYYDMHAGRNNVNNFTPWNTGWALRNDGVDLQVSDDPDGAVYNIGWIDPGEWVNYTVEIEQEGIYDVTFRVASEPGGALFFLRLDGLVASPILNVSSTGGWQSWTSITAEDVELPAGTHVLTLTFVNGKLNINSMDFELKTATSIDDAGSQPKRFALFQNYPNPFNPQTEIRYSIAEPGPVTLRIFDVAGKEVVTLVERDLHVGEHSAVWDGRDARQAKAASGVYFYKLEAGGKIQQRKMLLIQ